MASANKAVAVYRRLRADTLVAEVNMGGEMVRAVLRQVDPSVPLKEVHATRDEYLRAEPVASLYEQGKAKHVGVFPMLEDEMCDFGIDGLSSRRSPESARCTGLGSNGAHDGQPAYAAYPAALVKR
jgi:phage terminase large subunit-like protein